MLGRGGDDGVDDGPEVASDEDVRQRVEECGERTIVARGVSEFAGADLVGAPRDWNRANRGQIRFAKGPRRVYGFTRFSGAVVVGEGWYDLR